VTAPLASRAGTISISPNGQVLARTAITRTDPVYAASADGATVVSDRAFWAAAATGGLSSADPVFVAAMLNVSYPLGDATPFPGVRALGPATTLTLASGRPASSVSTVTSADPPHAADPANSSDLLRPAGYLRHGDHSGPAAVAAALVDAVAPLRSAAGPVELSLTGGKDSRLVAAALSAADVPFRARTHGFPDHPDVVVAAEVARHLGIEHTIATPVAPGQEADPLARQALRHELGLDQPLWRQYTGWTWRVLHGDLGRSLRAQQPVSALIAEKLPATLLLTTAAATIAVLIALPAGTLAAVRRNTAVDFLAMLGALLGVSIPSFWSGIMLILAFALVLGWFPAMGYVSPAADPIASLRHLVLPALTLGSVMAGAVTRQLRAQLLQELSRDYVRTARSKGLPAARVVLRHALRNSLIPAVTVLGVQFSILLGGAVITEQIFAWPGIGQLAVNAILNRDYPVLQGVILTVALLVTAANLAVDLAYALLDPRIRLA
jgi:peptide/nickel transport system permease protein